MARSFRPPCYWQRACRVACIPSCVTYAAERIARRRRPTYADVGHRSEEERYGNHRQSALAGSGDPGARVLDRRIALAAGLLADALVRDVECADRRRRDRSTRGHRHGLARALGGMVARGAGPLARGVALAAGLCR